MMSIDNTYKQTPIGLIPADWEVKRISELLNSGILIGHLDGNHGELYPKNNEFTDEGIPYISANNFFYGKMDYASCKYLPFERAKKFKKGIAIDGDVLFAHNATVGPVALLNTNLEFVILSTTATYFRCDNSRLYNLYLKEFLSSEFFRAQYVKVMGQSTRNQVPITAQRNLFTILPPIPEQQKIASILSTWDAAINTTQEIIAQLQQRNKGLAQKLLSGKMRVKGFEKTEWKILPIYKIAKEISLKNTNDKAHVVMSCTKYDGLVPSLEYFGRKIYSDDLTTYKIVKKGQFAYATNHIEEGSIGYQSKLDEALISPMYTVFETDGSINDNLLFKILKSHEYIHQYQKRMEGSIDRRGGLRWDEFSKIKVPVIDLEEQKAIVDILDTATAELNQYQQKLQTLQHQKKGLMQQLLSGKTRIKIK